jgi:hypothetical protein
MPKAERHALNGRVPPSREPNDIIERGSERVMRGQICEHASGD